MVGGGGRAPDGLFLAARLVVLPPCVTRQESFVLLCQLAQSGEQLPGLELEARQLPQTSKDKFGWPFHDLVYGRFLIARCDVEHTTRSGCIGEFFSGRASGVRCCVRPSRGRAGISG